MALPSADVLERVGLSGPQVGAWRTATPATMAPFAEAAQSTSRFLTRGEALRSALPPRSQRTAEEQAAADAIGQALDRARDEFLRAHAEHVYRVLTDDLTRPLRVENLVYEAAERYPGLVPTRDAMEAERRRTLTAKHGDEIAQGLLLAHVMSCPGAGAHLVHSMLRPLAEAEHRLDELRTTGAVDLGAAHVTRHGRAGVLELRNPRHLNAEDDTTLAQTELAVDLILLDPSIEVGVMRGGVVDHPRYEGQRIFGAGINLTRLYHGCIDFLFYVVRDMGYVHKIYRGLTGPEHHPGEPEDTTEKLWIAAVETYAIGGACQLLHVMDHVIATRGCRLYLPARREGIIPGASNLRLARFVGERVARQAIVSGREFEAGTPEAAPLCDEVVDPDRMDAAIEAATAALTSSGLINAAANRRAMRVGQEPLDIFRQYMATYAREQAYCHASPALAHNLEQHWNADRRSL